MLLVNEPSHNLAKKALGPIRHNETAEPSPIWMRASGAVSFQTIRPSVKVHFA